MPLVSTLQLLAMLFCSLGELRWDRTTLLKPLPTQPQTPCRLAAHFKHTVRTHTECKAGKISEIDCT